MEDELLAEMAWVRKLARALIKDAALADDVAQDTWLVAAEHQPDTDRPLRPWLARVVGKLAHTRRRTRARRDARDAAYDDGRSVPTPAELVERVELQRAVAAEVVALAEPYRSTVLLHFVEGYSSAEIARRLGIPDGTVRRRLKVALDQLRDALRERKDPPPRGWLAALVPLAHLPGPSTAPVALGAIAMKKVIAGVVLLLLLLAIGGIAWRRHHRAGEADEVAAGGGAGGVGGGTGSTQAQGAVNGAVPPVIPPWVVVRGEPARHVAGRVVARGVPIGGARVTLGLEVIDEPQMGGSLPDDVGAVLQPIAETTSAPDGTFDFGVQPAAPFRVSAVAPEYTPGVVPLNSAAARAKSDQLVIELGPCSTRLSGMILDASAGGIAKAKVSVAGFAGTESDATGAYRMCLAPRHTAGMPTTLVRVEADGYGTLREDVLTVGSLRHDFLLVPEAVLVGRVTTEDGQPVAAARVVANADPTEMEHHVASGWGMSDGDGRFRIAGLAPGAFMLSARADGLGTTGPIAVVARPAATSKELHLVVSTLARVRGQVMMAGAPVAGVTIITINANSGAPTTAESRQDGSFELEGVPYGARQLFVLQHRMMSANEIQVDRPLVEGVRLEVAKMGSVHGRVSRRGKPVAGADVMFQSPPQATVVGGPTNARTDASGDYTIEGVPAGPGRIFAWDAGGKTLTNFRAVDVADGEDKAVDIELDLSGEAKGVVVDEAGAPLEGVYVRLEADDGRDDMSESMTDAAGQFDCTMLTGGTYVALVAPTPGGRQGFKPAHGDRFDPITVPADGVTSGVTLAVINERLAIRGVVIDDTGAPVPDVHVSARGHAASTMDPPLAMTDAGGTFEIANLARGAYSLEVHAADGSDTSMPDVPAGGAAVTLRLPRAGAIEGTLAGFTTTPDVFTSILAPDLKLTRARVDGNQFSRIGLSPGRYTVEARAGVEVDGQIVEVRPGETAHVALTSRGVGSVEGTVADFLSRAPLAGMRCDAHVVSNGEISPVPPEAAYQAFSDAAGHFTMKAPVGRVRIFCFSITAGPVAPAGGDVDVASAAPAKVSVFGVRRPQVVPPSNPDFWLAPLSLPVTVSEVAPGRPAATAGLRAGDHLVAIDGAALDGVTSFGAMALVSNHRPGSTVVLGIERAGAPLTIKVPIAK